MSPFVSESQRKYMWAVHPDIARRWAENYPESNRNLPMYSHRKKKSRPQRRSVKNSFTNDVLVYIGKGKTLQSVLRHFNDHKPSAVKAAITRLKNSGNVKQTAQGRVIAKHL
jgi:hypothetical protein